MCIWLLWVAIINWMICRQYLLLCVISAWERFNLPITWVMIMENSDHVSSRLMEVIPANCLIKWVWVWPCVIFILILLLVKTLMELLTKQEAPLPVILVFTTPGRMMQDRDGALVLH